jgi:hypothetical protein
MLRHLIVDLFRRLWPVYAGTAAILALFWATAGSFPFGPGFFFALSMAAIFVLGPLIALTQVAPTEVHLLPLPRRDIWRATWCIGTVSACAATLIAKFAGVTAGTALSTGSPLGLSHVAVSSLVDGAYAGMVLGVMLLLRAGSSRPHGRIGRAVSVTAMTLAVVTFAGGALWGFLIQSYLPTEWLHLRGPAASLIVAGIGMAFAAYFHVPPAGARASSRGGEPGARQTSTRAVYWPRRLTGTRMILFEETLASAASFLLMIGYILLLARFVEPGGGVAETLRSWNFLPFMGGSPSTAIFPLVILGWVTLGATSNAFGSRVGTSWRQLRVLPLTTVGLARLLLLRRAMGWLAIWTVLVLVHVSATGSWPVTVRKELFVLALGVDALIYATQVRWHRHATGIPGVVIFGGMMFIFGLVLVLPLPLLAETWADTILLPIGLAALSSGAWLLIRTLRGSSKLYAPAPRAAPAGLL